MNRKIFTGLMTSCLMLMLFFMTLTGETNAQPPRKPNDKAKKLAVMGDQFFRQKDYRAAIDKYAEAISVSPNYPSAHFWKGYAHYYLNEYQPAITELDTAFNQGYAPLEIYKLRWYLQFYEGNYDLALADVQKGLRLEPTSSEFTFALGDVYRAKKQFQDAITAYKKFLQTSPTNGDAHYFLAVSYSGINDYNQQGLSAIEAIKNNTKYVGESYTLIGDALNIGKQPNEAIQAYERALNVKPELQGVYPVLSALYQTQSRLREAIETAKKGTKLFPNDGNLFVSLAWYYSLAERHAEAVAAGQQAVRLVPDQYMAYTNLCRAYNDTLQYSQAILTCNKALQLQPNDGETYLYLARAHDKSNKPDLATQYFKKAVVGLIEYTRNFPDSADGFYLLANAYYADDQRAKAIENFKKSLQLSPNFARARYNLGFMYFLDKNMPAANEQYDLLVKLDPVLAEKLKQAMGK